jgi:hypothetical protein
MLTLTVIISTINPGWGRAQLTLPDRFQGFAKRVAVDAAFSDDTAGEQHNRHAPVVNSVKGRIVVDIAELRLDAERAEGGECVIAEVAALAGDEDDLHDPRLLGTRLRG